MLRTLKAKLKARVQRAAWAGRDAQAAAQTIAELKGRVSDLGTEAGTAERTIDELRRQVADLGNELAGLGSACERLSNELEALRSAEPEPIDAGEVERIFRAALPGDLLNQPAVGSLIYPMPRPADGYVVDAPADDAPLASDGLPLPPPLLREGYGVQADGSYSDEAYLRSGISTAGRIEAMLDRQGFTLDRPIRVLDFGGSSGRVLRHFVPKVDLAGGGELWSVDCSSPNIAWAETHLCPPMNFAVTTTAPHLPFPDGYFDLIFAGSVFTHIAELTDAWLLELKRITKPGGFNVLTFFDEQSLNAVREGFDGNKAWPFIQEFDRETGVLSRPYAYFVYKSSPKLTRIAFGDAFLRSKLSRLFDLREVAHGAYGWQTAYVLQSTGPGTRGARDVTQHAGSGA